MQFAINLTHLMKCFPKTLEFVLFFACPSCKELVEKVWKGEADSRTLGK